MVGELIKTLAMAVRLLPLGWNPNHTEILKTRVSWITPRGHSTFSALHCQDHEQNAHKISYNEKNATCVWKCQ